MCVLYVLVIEKTEPRQHCETKRSRAWKQQTLLRVWVHERKPIPVDQGEVASLFYFVYLTTVY